MVLTEEERIKAQNRRRELNRIAQRKSRQKRSHQNQQNGDNLSIDDAPDSDIGASLTSCNTQHNLLLREEQRPTFAGSERVSDVADREDKISTWEDQPCLPSPSNCAQFWTPLQLHTIETWSDIGPQPRHSSGQNLTQSGLTDACRAQCNDLETLLDVASKFDPEVNRFELELQKTGWNELPLQSPSASSSAAHWTLDDYLDLSRSCDDHSISAVLPFGTSESGKQPLHIAAQRGNLNIMRALLNGNGTLDARDSQGMTPLHHAVKGGHVSATALLLQSGANVNAVDLEGWTALHIAVDAGWEDVVHLLVRNGADCNAKA